MNGFHTLENEYWKIALDICKDAELNGWTGLVPPCDFKSLPDIHHVRLSAFNNAPMGPAIGPGVYCLFQKDELVYVGTSVCMAARIAQHITCAAINFDSIVLIGAPAEDAKIIEQIIINQYNPTMNKQSYLLASIIFKIEHKLKYGHWF